MNKSAAALLTFLTLAGPVQAEDNVPEVPFPDSHCTKPDLESIKLPKLTAEHGHYDYTTPVGSYDSRIKAYNKAAAAYHSCIHAYVESAGIQTKKIQDQANAEVKRITDIANASMSAIHAKVNTAILEENNFALAQEAATAALREAPDTRRLRHQ